MRFRTIVTISSFLILSACNSSSPKSLEEITNGKSAEEKREILRRKCLTEAEWDLNEFSKRFSFRSHQVNDSGRTVETRHLRALCRELAEPPMTPMTNDGNSDGLKSESWKTSLAEKCRDEINEHIQRSNKDSINHLKKYKDICEAMTETKVDMEQLSRPSGG